MHVCVCVCVCVAPEELEQVVDNDVSALLLRTLLHSRASLCHLRLSGIQFLLLQGTRFPARVCMHVFVHGYVCWGFFSPWFVTVVLYVCAFVLLQENECLWHLYAPTPFAISSLLMVHIIYIYIYIYKHTHIHMRSYGASSSSSIIVVDGARAAMEDIWCFSHEDLSSCKCVCVCIYVCLCENMCVCIYTYIIIINESYESSVPMHTCIDIHVFCVVPSICIHVYTSALMHPDDSWHTCYPAFISNQQVHSQMHRPVACRCLSHSHARIRVYLRFHISIHTSVQTNQNTGIPGLPSSLSLLQTLACACSSPRLRRPTVFAHACEHASARKNMPTACLSIVCTLKHATRREPCAAETKLMLCMRLKVGERGEGEREREMRMLWIAR